MSNPRYVVATNLIRGKQIIAAAVIYSSEVVEPSFSYTIRGRNRTAYLYRRGDRVPSTLDASLSEHIRNSAVSWALVTAHASCSPDAALELAVIRAVERWVCRQTHLPSLAETLILLPTKKPLADLPATLVQMINVKDWHTASARALCRYRALLDAQK